MFSKRVLAGIAAVVVATAASTAAAQEVIDLSGEAPDDGSEFILVPFDVPAGTAELEVEHDDLSEANILDWGLLDPNGNRGWGGGNSENAVVGVHAASRSYVPGPLPPGQWNVVIGKAQVPEVPIQYQLRVTLRDAETLAPQPERAPYQPAPALEQGARWYAGDFHLHCRESGDASPTLDEVATYARGRGLDFVVVTDHNVVTQQDFYNDVQPRHPSLLLIPGFEYTTYAGHANAIGGTRWVDHKVGFGGVTIEGAAREIRDQGALLMINHPTFDLGDMCIGCAWEQDLSAEYIDAVEVGSGSALKTGALFGSSAVAFWENICASGRHAAAVGGSDDHKAGQNLGAFDSPIGDPTTMVFAEELSVAGILDGVRAGHTVVKLQGPDDPMVELSSSTPAQGDTVSAASVTLSATITGGDGHTVRFVHNGEAQPEVDVVGDPFVHQVRAVAPASGEDFWRVEVLERGKRRTVTSHIYLQTGPAEAAVDEATGGCGCRAARGQGRGGLGWLVALLAMVLVRLRGRV